MASAKGIHMIAAMFPIKTIEATRVGSCLYCSANMKQSTAGGSAANSKKTLH